MKFKTVNGLGRKEYASRALHTALEKGFGPEYLDAWLKWFDKSSRDPAPDSGCSPCEYGKGVVCPSECPEPEYRTADIEEVAAMTLERAYNAVVSLVGVTSPMHSAGGCYRVAPLWVNEVFDDLRAEIATPGYVAGLLRP